jgi:hypothetical protein
MMNRSKSTAFLALLLLIILTAGINSCRKIELERIVKLRTLSVDIISSNLCEVSGSIIDVGPRSVVQHGHCWSETPSPTITGMKSELGTRNNPGTFVTQMVDLEPNQPYFVRAYAMTETGEPVYGEILSFGIDPTHLAWQRSFGGSDKERPYSISSLSNGSYAIAGESYSSNGDVSGNHGLLDFWILSLDLEGNILWQRSCGGSKDDGATSIIKNYDGNYVVTGYSSSSDGDVSDNFGARDVWVIWLNEMGNIGFERNYGGSLNDMATCIIQTSDGGYAFTGYSESNDGQVSGNHGDKDIWICKTATNGDIEWQNSYGGNGVDVAESIIQTTDNGFVVAGYSNSNDGDVSGNQGKIDFWIFKVNPEGVLTWEYSYGGTEDDLAYTVIQTPEGGLAVIGQTYSNNGDVSGNHGGSDFWYLKLFQNGIVDWQKCFGGSGDDRGNSVLNANEGGFSLIGYSESNNGDVIGNHGQMDYWLVKINMEGQIEWQRSFGGSELDRAYSLIQTTDGSYIIPGSSYSNDGDVTGNMGSQDYWIVGIRPALFY